MPRTRHFLAASAAATVAATGVGAGIASADPVMDIPDGEMIMVGQADEINGYACVDEVGLQSTYAGQFVSPDAGATLYKTLETPTEPDGSWTWMLMPNGEAPMGDYEIYFYCSTAPVTSLDPSNPSANPDILWVSGMYERTLMEADARAASSGGSGPMVTIDPDALPRVDRMGIHGEEAAALKADVDAAVDDVAALDRLYGAFFGRHGDHAGMAHWLGQLERGASINQIANSFAKSTEFRTKYGSLSDSAFVDQAYRNVLGRSGDHSGHTFWMDALATGRMTRANVMRAFANSAENIARTANRGYVAAAYQVLGTTTPTKAQVQEQVAKLDTGVIPRVQVVEDIALQLDA